MINYILVVDVLLNEPLGYRSVPVVGAPIRFMASGIVTEDDYSADGCKFTLKVQHREDDNNVTNRYCLMQENSHSHQLGGVVAIGGNASLVRNTGIVFWTAFALHHEVRGRPC